MNINLNTNWCTDATSGDGGSDDDGVGGFKDSSFLLVGSVFVKQQTTSHFFFNFQTEMECFPSKAIYKINERMNSIDCAEI